MATIKMDLHFELNHIYSNIMKKIIKTKAKKSPKIYAFIDSQNLNLGTRKDIYRKNRCVYRGWKLDFSKFYKYLINKHKVTKAFLFIGLVPENENLYLNLRAYGYTLIFKNTVPDQSGKIKGNVDAEIVLHAAAIEFKNFDKAIFVSGDGDFACLYEFLEKKDKLAKIIIPNRKNESSLLKKYQQYKVFLIREKQKLKYIPKNISGRRGV